MSAVFSRTKWRLEAPTLHDLLYLCANMRQDEIEQWQALVDPEPFNFEAAAARMFTMPGMKFSLLGPGDVLLVAGGYFDMGNGVLRSWMVGTDWAWREHWRSITEGTNFVMECLLDDGYRRLETYALASREKTAIWYERGLKMQREGTLRNFGFNGESASVHARVRASAPKTDDWKEIELARRA